MRSSGRTGVANNRQDIMTVAVKIVTRVLLEAVADIETAELARGIQPEPVKHHAIVLHRSRHLQ